MAVEAELEKRVTHLVWNEFSIKGLAAKTTTEKNHIK